MDEQKEIPNSVNQEDLLEKNDDYKDFIKVLLSFKKYTQHSRKTFLNTMQYDYNNLSIEHKRLYSTFKDKVVALFDCVIANQKFLNILCNNDMIFANQDVSLENQVTTQYLSSLLLDGELFSKLFSTLKLIYRDWSKEGEIERQESYEVLIDTVVQLFPCNARICIPGSGLGRLIFEFAERGYDVVGIEHSFQMLVTSSYLLNTFLDIDQYTIYPWIHDHSNVISCENMVKKVHFPDVDISVMKDAEEGSMQVEACDFMLYYPDELFDCFVTCFFIDTAQNIIDYLEKNYDLLNENGVWINLGPLQWHWSDVPGLMSIELTWEEIKMILPKVGFELVVEDFMECRYCQNPHSLVQRRFDCVYFICKKVKVVEK
eukprot:TRINITY_DN2806_c0_g2_i1.p1 TRINITY_DN2806_c0_g2~~TRINITY_DN2806_c0_g2_i1.p1  ORF type:complete len:385 (+),score=82.94 TRINITY_DN2806_c0_g2_i1:39-1157(+)